MASWTEAQKYRLGMESYLLQREFPHFSFYNHSAAGETTVQGNHTTTANRLYTLCIKLRAGFPDQMPLVYITSPCPLYGYGGKTIQSYGTSHAMHVFAPDWNKYVKLCLIREEFWTASDTILGLVMRGLLWLEAYEVHCRTGQNIDEFSLAYG